MAGRNKVTPVVEAASAPTDAVATTRGEGGSSGAPSSAEQAFTEDVMRRYQSYGWQTIHVEDGDTDLPGIHAAITKARHEPATRTPALALYKTRPHLAFIHAAI